MTLTDRPSGLSQFARAVSCLRPAPGVVAASARRGGHFRSLLAAALAILAGPSLACDFYSFNSTKDIQDLVDGTKGPNGVLDPTTVSRAVIYDVPGKIQVQHGHACSEPERVGVMVHDQAVFPAGYDEATVIFNGSVARYRDGDHHIRLMGSAISNVEVRVGANGRELHWNAAGSLTDDNLNEFNWCYFYTLAFWRRASSGLQAIIHPQPDEKIFGEFDKPPRAVHDIAGSVTVPDNLVSVYGGPRALLPRGHAMWFGADVDHAFFQAGFDLGTPTFTAKGVSWKSQALLKDDDSWRAYSSAELVEVMNGPSVNMWQPPTVSHFIATPTPHWGSEPTAFALHAEAPEEPTFPARCVASQPGIVSDHYAVDVPFSFAIPMLTGWELTEPCDDSHVREIGAYIESFSFKPYANGRGGLLGYTVVTRVSDDDEGKVGRTRNKVTILGLNPVLPGRFNANTFTSPLPTSVAP